ncbi:acyltransferase family protein [Methanosarcina mazei]|jgi:fucose 4-O-acetylase-like acetyltransferase|uniref:Putative glycosyltransferase n=1 Tax=Methanosarcina mazei LYC TaxID=1434114 RepID=A0A0E3RPA3_METMZ|nr:acyltransferase family protein [Methanosarcina mazei]AKB68185.1 putative glycosyltransferase [Methanosarcina mazei LYC]
MRLHWIDSLKGIGIMLVVLAHHSLPIALDTYIFSFHMPLFFFISGFLFDFGKYAESASNFVKGRFRSLIVPYFCFALITCLFYYMMDELFTPGVPSIEFFKHIILVENSILHGVSHILLGFGLAVSYNSPLWFLTCLFVTELLFYGLTKKYYSEPRKIVFWLTVSGIIGYLYSVYVLPFRIPWNVDVALAAIVFYGAGNLFRKLTESETESRTDISFKLDSGIRDKFSKNGKYLPVIATLLSAFYLGYLLKFPTENKVNMNVLQYGENFFSFYILAFVGIFTFVYLFKKIGSSNVLEYYGRNSLIILALHFPIKDVVTKVAAIVLGVNSEYFYYNAGFALGFTVLNLILLVPVIYVINNYFPFILVSRQSTIVG